MLLTKTIIEKLTPSAKATANRPDKHTDGNGLQLLVRPTGTKTWIASYYWHGKNQNITIGRYPAISLREARERNNEIRQTLHRGINPKDELLEQKRLQSGAYSFKAYAKRYHELHSQKVTQSTMTATKSLYERHISPALDDMPVVNITPLDVLKMAQATAKASGGGQARRAVKQTQNILKIAMVEGIITANPANDVTMLLPATPATTNRARVASDELPQLLKDINCYHGTEEIKLALLLLAHTFTRVSELVTAEWHEIDLDRELWTIPANKMKMNREHTIPLSPQVITILKRLLELNKGRSNYLLYNPATGKHFTRASITNALHVIGYKGRMTAHGFRGIASTMLNDMDYKPEAIEIQLAHITGSKTSRAYNHSNQLLYRRKMLNDWSRFLTEALAGKNKPATNTDFLSLNEDTKLNIM